jgi:hypothetical protein
MPPAGGVVGLLCLVRIDHRLHGLHRGIETL